MDFGLEIGLNGSQRKVDVSRYSSDRLASLAAVLADIEPA
jgi:hypothetical protein